jgi:hypothetical protein
MLLQEHIMSKIVTPEALLNSQVEEFNKGNISFLMTLYEKDACFASKPGHVVKDLESIRRTLQDFIGKVRSQNKESTSGTQSCTINYRMVAQWN